MSIGPRVIPKTARTYNNHLYIYEIATLGSQRSLNPRKAPIKANCVLLGQLEEDTVPLPSLSMRGCPSFSSSDCGKGNWHFAPQGMETYNLGLAPNTQTLAKERKKKQFLARIPLNPCHFRFMGELRCSPGLPMSLSPAAAGRGAPASCSPA
jgi:hypothetical protein